MTAKSVDTKHPQFTRFEPDYRMVRDCFEGERAIKERGTVYLPRGEGWTDSRYDRYKLRARFVNATGRTASGLLGIAFNRAPTIELSGPLTVLQDNCDNRGKTMLQLARDMVAGNLAFGRGCLIADYTASADQGQLPLARAGRPFLRHFTSDQIINWRVKDGKLILLVVQWDEEQDTDPDDFACYAVRRWLEFRLINGVAYVRKWSYAAGVPRITASNPQNIEAVSELLPLRALGKPVDHIPCNWYGAENNDETPDVPPLADIASLNIGHYQSDADVCEAAFLCGQATPVISGLSEAWAARFMKDGLFMGSNDGVLLPVNADMKMVQAAETSMSVSLVERREKQMAMLGAKLVERGSASRTATQAGDEAQTDNSILSQCVGNVESCINRALIDLAMYAGGEGMITLNKKYEISTLDSQTITALVGMVQNGMLSLTNLIRWQQRNGLVPEDMTPDQIETDLRNQKPLPNMLAPDLISDSNDDDNGDQVDGNDGQ